MKIIETACLMIVTICVAVLGIEGILLLRETRLKMDQLVGQYSQLVEPGMKAEASIAAAGITIAQVGAEERNAFAAQNKYFTDLSSRTIPLLDSANVTITKLGAAADQFGSVAPAANSAIIKLTDDAGNIVTGLAPSIQNMNAATKALATDLSDPAIHESLTHVDKSAGNVEATTSDIAAFTHRELAPVRGTWNVIKSFLRDFAGPAAQVGTALK